MNAGARQEIRWDCLIDTGADSCLFPGSIAELVGHDLSAEGVSSSVTMGVGSIDVQTWIHTFRLQLMYPGRDRAVWVKSGLKIECTSGRASFPPLLGYANFLKHFRLTIDYPKRHTVVEWRD